MGTEAHTNPEELIPHLPEEKVTSFTGVQTQEQGPPSAQAGIPPETIVSNNFLGDVFTSCVYIST